MMISIVFYVFYEVIFKNRQTTRQPTYCLPGAHETIDRSR